MTTKRKRFQLTNFEPTRTDQAAAAEMTMLSIVKKLERGQMPPLNLSGFYGEQPSVKNLQDVFEISQNAKNLYDQLPTEIKRRMGNDYKNLETFINNPDNKDLLIQYKLIETEQPDQTLETLKSIDKKLSSSKEPQKAP